MRNAIFNIRSENCITVVEFVQAVTDEYGLLDLAYGLSDLCGELRSDSNTAVVVLADTANSAFSIGQKVIEQSALLDKAAWEQTSRMFEPITALDQPVIAAVNGDAIGFGLEMALACDIRIATTASHFGLPHVKHQLLPWCGGSQRLPRVVGRGKALELLFTGDSIDAQTAQTIGLVSRIVSPAELMSSVMEIAGILTTRGPLAMGYIKEAVNKGMDLSLEQGLRLEADLYFLLHTTGDRAEGVTAFRERRDPEFKGK